jgi:cytosine deaminase
MENAVKMGANVIGAIPHFEFTREYSVESLNFIMELAVKYDKLVDVHCDEIDDEASRGLETLAARAYEMELFDKVTASHTTAMHSYNNAYVVRLMRLLKMSRINFVANPLVNTHLQGRMDTYPKRRGITRVKELTEEGINVSFGQDDFFDPWYPMGNGNMRDVVFMGLHVCQMMGYDDIMNSYKFVTSNAAKTLHLGESYGIKAGNPASFVVLDAKNYYDALNFNAAVLRSYNKGRLIAQSEPAKKDVMF